MFDSLESFLLGLATVIDTVLLITLFERTNRPLVALWLKLLIGSLGSPMLPRSSMCC